MATPKNRPKLKIFSDDYLDDYFASNLETAYNTWISENPDVEVIDKLQSSAQAGAGMHTMISVWYIGKTEEERQRP